MHKKSIPIYRRTDSIGWGVRRGSIDCKDTAPVVAVTRTQDLQCHLCDRELQAAQAFCTGCGTKRGDVLKRVTTCGRCGLPLSANHLFCTSCGVSVDDDTSREQLYEAVLTFKTGQKRIAKLCHSETLQGRKETGRFKKVG